MATVVPTDIGGSLRSVFLGSNNTVEATAGSGAPELLVAAGAGDNTKIVGNSIDRFSYGMPQSMLVSVTAYMNLADTETLSYAVEIQESSDNSTWDTAEAIQAATVVKTASGAYTDGFTVDYKVYLGDRKRYFRVNVTPNLSASGTDTGVVQVVGILGGAQDNASLVSTQATDGF